MQTRSEVKRNRSRSCARNILGGLALSLLSQLSHSAGLQCTVNPDEGPVLIFRNRVVVQDSVTKLEPGWRISGAWGGTTVTGVQTPGQGSSAEKSLLVHYPIAWKGTGVYTENLSAYIGDKSALTFRIRKESADGNVLVGLHESMTDTIGTWVYVSSYLFPLQSSQFIAGQWYSVRIPLSDFQATNSYIKGIVFQSSVAGDVYLDDIMITVPLVLKWPLATPSYANKFVTQKFGIDWAGETYCPAGVIKKHNGTDYRATAGTVVYAAESGVVKEILPYNATWAQNIVLEHMTLSGQIYTTVYWHVTPVAGLDGFIGPIAKGQKIGTVADIGSGTHFHFGVHLGSYASAYFNNTPYAGTGALPQNNCQDATSGKWYPAFPAGFVDPEDIKKVLFR
ncbi:MAG: M23 family metallopeptidase [bacterium]|nr:M23 family metallopeptidase [bacterium]